MSEQRPLLAPLPSTAAVGGGLLPGQSHTDALAARGTERTFRRGLLLIQEGDLGSTLFIVRSGRLRAYAADPQGKEITLGIYGAGEYVGEMSLDGGPRSATVTAATDMVCYGLTFWEFRPLVEKNGAIGWKLLQALTKRLRAADA